MSMIHFYLAEEMMQFIVLMCGLEEILRLFGHDSWCFSFMLPVYLFSPLIKFYLNLRNLFFKNI